MTVRTDIFLYTEKLSIASLLKIEKFNKWSVVKFIFHRLVRYNEDDFICENPWQNKQRFGSIIFVSRLPAVRDLPASVIVTKYVTQLNLYIKDGHGW